MDSLELRKVSSVAALALVLGAASCSGDSGRGDGSESATTTATTQGTSGTTGDATGSTSGGGSGSTGTGTTSGGGETVGTTSGSTGATTSGGVECTDHRQCGDGKCIAGSCCAIEDACGDVACCGGGEVCLFDQCVVPGAPCKSANDCAEGEYCEPALGEGEGDTTGGDTTGGDMACTQSIPDAGYCLKLPEVCGPGQDPMKDGCVAACEYYPDAGKLNATLKWQWGLYAADEFSKFSDVWSTPTVGRIYDANCDGKVDDTDPPNVVFVSGNSNQTCCSCGNEPISTCRTGILRVLDGASGQEIWSLDKAKAGNYGFAGVSVALGDIDNDGDVEIITATGDGFVAAISNEGVVEAISDLQIDGQNAGAFGWGGGLSVADMDGDGYPEIAFGRTLFSTKNGIKREWVGAGGIGGGNTSALSHMVDLDNDGKLELLAGNTAYSADGSIFWQNAGLPDGFTAIGDFDLDGTPEVVLVGNGQVWILQAENGGIDLGPVAIPGGLNGGGPPTVADFDGEPDKRPEIGVAGGAYYAVFKPDYQNSKINIAWQLATKDTSSRVTGSSVFDFEGDGRAEVIYSDECFLWILDGVDGTLRFAEPNTTFTATEAIIVADVDGDGHAEVVRVSNSANWQCNTAPWNQPDPKTGRPAWKPPPNQSYYKGISVFGDSANSWVGTRTLWNQHAYYVTNICDPRDSACDPMAPYGSIPAKEKQNWKQGWLNNFRQNVQDGGIFDAPDAAVSLQSLCGEPPLVLEVGVRNLGLVGLPAGVEASVFKVEGMVETLVETVTTTKPLLPGQTEVFQVIVPVDVGMAGDTFLARIVVDPNNPKFHECDDTNNATPPLDTFCPG